MKTLTSFILLSLLCLGQSHAYDLSKKFGIGAGVGFPIPVWGNQFNHLADPEWGASLHGRYHIDQSIGWDLSVSKQGFKKTPFEFENLNLLAFWRAAGSANLTPVFGLGAGVTRIQDYVPHNLKLSLLARAGVEYALTPILSLGALVDYQYVSKIMGKMPTTGPAHVINPQLALTWYFGAEGIAEKTEGDKVESKTSEKEKNNDTVTTSRSSTAREEAKPDIMVQFDFAKAEVKPQYFNQLKQLAKRLSSSTELDGYIEGHADSTGPENFNDALSIKRAEAVRKKLIEYGADEYRLKAEGFGESRPIADNNTVEGRRKNRRSAVYISVRTQLSSVY